MQHHEAVVVATSNDRRNAICQSGVSLGQKSKVDICWSFAVDSFTIRSRQIDGAVPGRSPIWLGGIEVRVRDDDGFETSQGVDLVRRQ